MEILDYKLVINHCRQKLKLTEKNIAIKVNISTHVKIFILRHQLALVIVLVDIQVTSLVATSFKIKLRVLLHLNKVQQKR